MIRATGQPDNAAPAIAVQGLTKSFGGRRVVDGVSMTVAGGEIAGFLGPNGSGKTTCIRMMCGLLTPDAGGGTVLGLDLLRQQRALRREVGYMTQRFSLYEDLSVRQNLAFVAGLYLLDPQAVAETLADLGLTARADQLAGSLSGGWKQRLALAACIMHRPRLLLLDEPTAGVDPKARRQFWDEIHARAAAGMTVLVSTHYMDEAERCHRVHYIAHGRLVTSGTVDEVIAAAGLVTREVETDSPGALAALLRQSPGVAQVEPFGTSLHVTGTDAGRLDAALAAAGVRATPAETSLEDVFIRLMEQSEADPR